MQNNELEQSLIPGRTSFLLTTNEKKLYRTKFYNTACKVINKTRQKNWYLIETRQHFNETGSEKNFADVNKFLILIRNPLKFRKEQKHGVFVYLPPDADNPVHFELSGMKLVSWAFIDKIKTEGEAINASAGNRFPTQFGY